MDKLKVLFLANYPSPYRVDFFNLLGQSVDLTVLFIAESKEQKHRNKAWFHENYSGFHAVFLKRSRGILSKRICPDVIDYLKWDWDVIISGGYAEPTQMLAFEWLKYHRKPFYMEIDGGLVKQESGIKKAFKKHFISMPCGWFSTGEASDQYLIHYGAKADKIIRYPFTSLWQTDLDEARCSLGSDKRSVRKTLGLSENRIVLAVGQFIHRKGFDVLIRAASKLPVDAGVYIVGGEPPNEYLTLREQTGAANVHFVGFKPKEELKHYYLAADVFAMPTREDVWGLVVNEALSYGLPVISSDQCGAALELINDGENGYIVPADDPDALADAIEKAFSEDIRTLSLNAVSSVGEYSVEKMVKKHREVFESLSDAW